MATQRAGGYDRVSREEQAEGYSLDAQSRAIGEYCAQRGWTFVPYEEPGRSARTKNLAKRPAFRNLMEDARGGKLDVIVVHKLDRCSRNLRVTLESLDALAKAGVAFISLTEQIDYSDPKGCSS